MKRFDFCGALRISPWHRPLILIEQHRWNNDPDQFFVIRDFCIHPAGWLILSGTKGSSWEKSNEADSKQTATIRV